ncbi:MAG: glycoside hydrolase [Muribaculaceae bacterium]|nr:glycoside hydrolase [Muribaculaceae bacterium]
MNSILKKAAAVMLTIACCLGAGAQTPPNRSLVFDLNTYGSKYYRIPGIVTAKDGSLVAVADKRIEHNGDLPAKIDVVVKRSTDGGKTWGEQITVARHDSIGGFGDPAIVVDKKTGDILIICSHGNGLWQKSPAHISVIRSKDNGLTWGEPLDINPQIYSTTGEKGKLNVTSMFASSGAATQLKNGRIMFALVTRQDGVKDFPVYAVYSDDGGKTWKVSDNPATLNGDESKIVQLKDGSLIMSIRNRYKGPRIFSYSKDNGKTWSDPVEMKDLPDPACNGDILRYSVDGRNLLLQTMPGHPSKRENVSVWVSSDNGKTWPHKHQIVNCPSGYSAMTVLPNGNIGFLIEEEADNGDGYRLWFTELPIDEILK